MKLSNTLVYPLLLILAFTGVVLAHTPVPLEYVPAVVLDAVRQRMPQLRVTEASVDVEGDLVMYAIAGSSDAEELVVEVTTQGTVIQILDRESYEEHVD
jgi:hypothetical protein